MKKFRIITVMLFLFSVFGCVNAPQIDDTPEEITDIDIARIAPVAKDFQSMQNVVVFLTQEDLNYAIKYFDHFVEVLKLANINSVVVEIDNFELLDVEDSDNDKFINFVNLLDYKGITVIYKFSFEKFLPEFKLDMDEDEHEDLLEELEERLEIVNNFFTSLDNNSQLGSFLVDIEMPTKVDMSENVKKSSLLSLYYNNGFGVDKENEKAYLKAVEKLKFWREIFPLERIIWNVNALNYPKGLNEKILDKRLGINLLDIIDLLFVTNSSDKIAAKSFYQAKSTIMQNKIVTGINFGDIENWEDFAKIIHNIKTINEKNDGFGGLYMLNYGDFYTLWRGSNKYMEVK